MPICTQGMQRTWWPEAGIIIVTGPYWWWVMAWTSSKWGKFWLWCSINPQNNRALNQCLLHLWSKFGDPSLKCWWIIARTSSWLSDTYTHTHTHAGNDNTRRLKLASGKNKNIIRFPAQKPVTRSFDVSFDLRLNKRLSKQSWGWWFESPSYPLWHHCNAH